MRRKDKMENEILFLYQSVRNYIEKSKNCNRNCKINETIYLPIHSGNTKEIYDIFQKPENDSINYEDEKPEGDEDKRETEDFQDRTNKYIQESENNSSSDIELPTSIRKDSCLCGGIIRQKIGKTKENSGICQNRDEDFHNVIGVRG
jgi:hypothetical protein